MIDKLLSNITGRQHHFKVVSRYTPNADDGSRYVERVSTIWMKDRRYIIDEREIRKHIGPTMIAETPRAFLTNGRIAIREVYYLGWFKPKP